MASSTPKPIPSQSVNMDGEEAQELGGCTGCCIMCCFGCLTCCGCRNWVCRTLIFFPPNPPFYKLGKDEGKELLRIPINLLPQTENLSEEDLKLMTPAVLPKPLEVRILKLKTTKNSEITACYITHKSAKDTILYSHGNATDVGMQSYAVETLVLGLRVNVLFYDYTGYGFSANPGRPSPAHIESDADAAFKYLVEKEGVPAKNIILYGQSLGSVPSCLLAKKYRVKGMVIHAGLASALRVLKPSLQKSPWFDLFRNVDNIKMAKCPVFVIHGTADMAVPFSNGKALYDNAPQKIAPWWVKGAHHNDIEMNYARQYYVKLEASFREFRRLQTLSGAESKTPNDAEAKIGSAPIIHQPNTSL
mmetsp:Transcript_18085/g.44345  ORF Transcript_18085/g.44345 Transcript_18085/m.44345 type:complete len:361 (-) Transcript_18085:101-1183(-)|eukprot:CAMPEP_0114508526 /NCGR_PEP_ID=MMETSP0109-20121206/12659_1 /TAXON_ID=29199 /ORGANISM="Chlorarachnion reptans, Strain CCCM449" /LENGTH=360 /DNA_ID=CAMNT_0001687489 /DNA_START=260 /DNA_END=1342 /DNA_ORIENTATION=+